MPDPPKRSAPTGGVDAGLVQMGLAVVFDGEIVACHQIKGRAGLTKVPASVRCQAVIETARAQALAAAEWFADFAVEEIAVESYEWQGEDRGNLSHAWMVSMLVGALGVSLGQRLVLQRSVDVKHPIYGYGRLLEAWKGGKRGVVKGDELGTNEHKRDAALHALWAEASSWQRRRPDHLIPSDGFAPSAHRVAS